MRNLQRVVVVAIGVGEGSTQTGQSKGPAQGDERDERPVVALHQQPRSGTRLAPGVFGAENVKKRQSPPHTAELAHPLACSRLGRAFGVRNLPQSSKASRHPRQSFPFLSSTTHLGLANLGSCGRTGEESSALEAREIGHKRARRTRERSTSFSERWKETSTRWILWRLPAERAQTPWYTHPPTFSLPPQCSRRTLSGASPVLRRSILFAFCFFFSNPEGATPAVPHDQSSTVSSLRCVCCCCVLRVACYVCVVVFCCCVLRVVCVLGCAGA